MCCIYSNGLQPQKSIIIQEPKHSPVNTSINDHNDDDDDDWLSDDSLQKDKGFFVERYSDNVSLISELTGDSARLPHSPKSNFNSNKSFKRSRKKKKNVWKMDPIPIRPFVHLPTNGSVS